MIHIHNTFTQGRRHKDAAMNHPLTDKICYEMALKSKAWNLGFSNDDMRAAYDLAVEHITEQWEEVIDSNKTDIQVIREFDKRLKAMRPQEDN